MIRINKSPNPPEWLRLHGPGEQRTLEAAYDADPAACQRPGTPALKPARRVYARAVVKRQLRADQHHKCACCESKFTRSSPGDVEHYRPKAGYQQTGTGPMRGPGYYWLAYEWNNLLFACEDCNRTHKRNQFPVGNPAGRAQCHHDDPRQETPLLLHPAFGPNPETQLTFRAETAVGLTDAGETTRQVCGLNRPDLLEARRDYLEQVQDQLFLATTLDANPPVVDLQQLVILFGSDDELSRKISAAQVNARKLGRANAPFAGMVRANFPHLPTA